MFAILKGKDDHKILEIWIYYGRSVFSQQFSNDVT